jgi:excisionase family DNA binding protein
MDDLLDLKEVATILKVGRAAVQIWAKQGRIPAVKIGKSYRVRRSDLEAWYDGQRRNLQSLAGAGAERIAPPSP